MTTLRTTSRSRGGTPGLARRAVLTGIHPCFYWRLAICRIFEAGWLWRCFFFARVGEYAANLLRAVNAANMREARLGVTSALKVLSSAGLPRCFFLERAMLGLYVLDGRAVRRVSDLAEWSRLFEVDNRRVAETRVGGVCVSTVFLGVDHGHSAGGPPLLFETLVFGGVLDGEMARYASFGEAELGHAAMVGRLKEAGDG